MLIYFPLANVRRVRYDGELQVRQAGSVPFDKLKGSSPFQQLDFSYSGRKGIAQVPSRAGFLESPDRPQSDAS